MAKRIVRNKKHRARRLGLLAAVLLFLILLGTALTLGLSSCAGNAAPAAEGALWDGGWYGDDLHRIDSDGALVRGMKVFERKTGTRPYLWLTSGIDPAALEDFAKAQHEAMFTGSNHLLVVYDEWGDGVYYLTAQRGRVSTLTAGDVTTLLSCLEKAYADPANTSYAAAFGKGFRQGADQIIRVEGREGVGLLLFLGLVLVVLSVILIVFLRKRARWSGRWTDDIDQYVEDDVEDDG